MVHLACNSRCFQNKLFLVALLGCVLAGSTDMKSSIPSKGDDACQDSLRQAALAVSRRRYSWLAYDGALLRADRRRAGALACGQRTASNSPPSHAYAVFRGGKLLEHHIEITLIPSTPEIETAGSDVASHSGPRASWRLRGVDNPSRARPVHISRRG